MNTALLDLYIRYNNNHEEYEKKFRKKYEDLESEIEHLILNLSFKELIEIYIKYSTFRYLHTNNHEYLLNYVYMMIINKLEDSDIYDLLDADVVLSNNILTLNRRVKENKNTVQARKLNLESDFFLDYNAKITNKTKKEYKLYYQNELQNRQLSLDLFMNSLKYSVKLKEEIGIYLEQKIKDLCDQDKEIFRIYLNESIVDSADSVMFIDDYIDQVDNKIEIYKHYRDCTCISKTRKN